MLFVAHSWASFKHGVMRPEEVLRQAARHGVPAVVLADVQNTAGVPEFVRQAGEHGVRPVAGITFGPGAAPWYVGLAAGNEGYHHLNELLSAHLLDGVPLPQRPPELPGTFIVYPFGPSAPCDLRPNERIGVRPQDLMRLPFSPWARRTDQLVAYLPVTFRDEADHRLHRLLRTIARNTVLSLLPPTDLASPDERFLTPEAVRQLYHTVPELVRNAEELLERCSIAFDATDKTRAVFGSSAAADRERLRADACAGLERRYPQAGNKERARLEKELQVIMDMGFTSYFLINQDIVRFARSKDFFHVGRGSGANSLVAYCLGITDVDPMELDLYFERFISPARKKPPDFDIDFSWKDRDEVLHYVFDRYGAAHTAQLATFTTFQWRGAIRELGKAVGLPPAEIDALSDGDSGHYKFRLEQPAGSRAGDLDRVARAVVRYAERLRGMPHQFGIHAGGIIISERPMTWHTALHRLPKGFPVTQFSMLEAEDLGLHKFDLLSQRGLGHIRDAVELVGREAGDADGRGPLSVALSHGPVHAGVPDALERTGANGQQPAGTGQRMMDDGPRTAINGPSPAAIDIHDIPRFKQDPAIKDLIRRGDTVGCFYVESPAMRMLLKKLQVTDYLGLVAASSIIRPGVAESGMMREYLLRHHDVERRKLAPPALYAIMPDTYGVMVYQEDVIKVAHYYAGLTLDESDILRRGMTSRFRERPEFKQVEGKFFANCKARGYPDAEVHEIWRQIESFASFSFAKGHSASYAVESYQSLYLKAHHPLEFMVAVANNFGGFYSTELYLHEAKRVGATIEAPCVNTSDELCRLVRGTDVHRIYLGLGNIASLNEEVVRLLLHERRRHGAFTSLQDLLRRVPLPVEQARILVRAGALRCTGRSKPQLLWDLALMHHGTSDASPVPDLFTTKVEEPRLPHLEHYPLADAYDELELLGFPLCDPFTLVKYVKDEDKAPAEATLGVVGARAQPCEGRPWWERDGERITLARELPRSVGRRVTLLGYMVHVKATDTHHGQRMSFGSFIDPAGDLWDSTQFPDVAVRFPFRGRGVYRLTGVVEEEFGHCALRTEHMEKLPWLPDPRYGEK